MSNTTNDLAAPASLRPDQMRQSRVGKRPVELPKGVTVTVANGKIDVKGPKGSLSRALTPNVKVKIEGNEVHVLPTVTGRDGARFQGLARSIINGMIVGAGTGYVKTLQLVGTGYRAEVKGKILNLALGFSHPVNFPIPDGIKVEIPGDSKGTLIILSGADKEAMGQAAAKIRGFRPPEPYHGKGVRYEEEVIQTMEDLVAVGTDVLTLGQYLQPTKKHLPVQRFVHPDEFAELREIGYQIGFDYVESGPLVRSSYHSEKHVIPGYGKNKWMEEKQLAII